MSKPLHAKTSALQSVGLFADVKSFDELEARIVALPDEQARGNAFEVFAEAYLATQRRHDLPQVWPLAAVPSDVLRRLALPLNDYGVDGVAQTVLGGFDVYQVKFRSGRQPLTWRELSTFMGLADSASIHSRVLFTNCDDLPAVMNERKDFFCIRGSDLDRLEESDFRVIESWLAQARMPTPRKQPRPHQQEALDALLPAFRKHDRVTAIMACGTGKTLVALWVPAWPS
jgi:predicted helicase